MFRILDRYIIKKFLGTFFFSIILIISIAIIFDISENIDGFLERDAPLKAIIFSHYLPFIPYFANLFSYLFIFISVIFFTSKLASKSEIIAMLSSGISFRRLLWPYFLSALVLAIFSFMLSAYIIPPANEVRENFQDLYIRHKFHNFDQNIHRQIEPGLFAYMENYNVDFNQGYLFTLEKIEDGKLVSKLNCDYIRWDSLSGKWQVNNYMIRTICDDEETIETGQRMDTVINLHPNDFEHRETIVETMNLDRLNAFIDEQRMNGTENVVIYEVYRYKLFSYPFSAFILTLLGVTIAMRRARRGIGVHIGIGLTLSFTYILLMQFSTNFATGGNMNPLLAVWIPNMFFMIIGIILYRFAPK